MVTSAGSRPAALAACAKGSCMTGFLPSTKRTRGRFFTADPVAPRQRFDQQWHVGAAALHCGTEFCRKPGRDRHRSPRDFLLPATLARTRHHRARIGPVVLEILNIKPGELADSGT